MSVDAALPPGDPVLSQITDVGEWLTASNTRTAARWDDVVQQEPHLVATMRTPASNTVGAALRVAFWLSVALRVALHQQRQAAGVGGALPIVVPTGRTIHLLKVAIGAYLMALDMAAMSAAHFLGGMGWAAEWITTSGGGFIRSSDRRELRKVYELGIAAAEQGGSPRAILELQRLASARPPADKDAIPDVLQQQNPDGSKRLPWWVPVVAVGVVLAGAGFALAPWATMATALITTGGAVASRR